MKSAIIENTQAIFTPISLPSGRPEVKEFSYDLLPNVLSAFVKDTVERQQCPPDFIAVTALCGLAGVLGNKACIYPKQNDDWKIIPTLWAPLIGRPSAMKSPSMKAALEPLKAIEKEYQRCYDENIKLHETQKIYAKLALQNAETEARKKIKVNDKSAASELIAGANAEVSEPPLMERLIVNDTTPEKLGELLSQNPNGLLVVRDELSGWLAKLMKEEYQADRAFYLECFDGDARYRVDRIGRGSTVIEHCTLSLVGGIQPSKLAPLVRGAVNGSNDDGLLQRLQLAVWPDDRKTWTWLDKAPDEITQQNYNALFIAMLNYCPESKGHRFSIDAQQLFIEWMEEIQAKARDENTSPIMESYLLKLPKSISAIALIFELVTKCENGTIKPEDVNGVIGIDAIAMALDWADYLISHANRIFAFAQNSYIDAAKLILKRRNKLPDVFKCRDLVHKGWGLGNAKDIYEALELLVDHNYLIEHQSAFSPSGGRPSVTYSWVSDKGS
jgi:hypothetical protein